MNDGSSSGPLVGVSGVAWESCWTATDNWGLKGNRTHLMILKCEVVLDGDRVAWPLARLLSPGSLGRCGGREASAPFGSPVVLQLTVGPSRAGTGLQEVWTHQSVLLFTLVVREAKMRRFIFRGEITNTYRMYTLGTAAIFFHNRIHSGCHEHFTKNTQMTYFNTQTQTLALSDNWSEEKNEWTFIGAEYYNTQRWWMKRNIACSKKGKPSTIP